MITKNGTPLPRDLAGGEDDGEVARALAGGDQGHEQPEVYPHHPSGEGQGVADHREPGHHQGPYAEYWAAHDLSRGLTEQG